MYLFRALFTSHEESVDLFFQSFHEEPKLFKERLNRCILSTMQIYVDDELNGYDQPRYRVEPEHIFRYTSVHDYRSIFIEAMKAEGYHLIETSRENTARIDLWKSFDKDEIQNGPIVYDED